MTYACVRTALSLNEKPAPPVIPYTENDRYGSIGLEADGPPPVGREEWVLYDGRDIEIFEPRALDKSALARASEVVLRRVVSSLPSFWLNR